MTMYRKILAILIIIFMATAILENNFGKFIGIRKCFAASNHSPVKVSLFSHNLNGDYVASVCKYLDRIQHLNIHALNA